MKQLFIICSCLLFYISAFSQFNWETQVGYSYLNHSKTNGFSFNNNLQYQLNEKSSLVIGGNLNYGEGNRNFELHPEHLYTFEYDDYYPPYQALAGLTYGYDFWKELNITTSVTYQLTSTISYNRHFSINEKILTIGSGLFFSYVNKAYIATIVEDTDLFWISSNLDIQYDLAIPFHLRYYDTGIFLRGNINIYKRENLSIGIASAYYQPLNSKGWLDVGATFRFKI